MNKKRQEILELKEKQLKEKKNADLEKQFEDQLFSLKSKAKDFDRSATKHMNNSNKYMKEAQSAERSGNSALSESKITLAMTERNVEKKYRENFTKLTQLYLEMEMQMKTTNLNKDFGKLTKIIDDTLNGIYSEQLTVENKNEQFNNALDRLKETSEAVGAMKITNVSAAQNEEIETAKNQIKAVVEFEKNQQFLDSMIISDIESEEKNKDIKTNNANKQTN